MGPINLTSAEWNIMECLWESAPQTGRELAEKMKDRMGRSRSTTLTLLLLLVDKGVVLCDSEGTKNTPFLPPWAGRTRRGRRRRAFWTASIRGA